MADELSSTNINDIINEDDTEINDDVVDKILNELENSDVTQNNNIRNEDDFRNSDIRNNNFKNDDFDNNFDNDFDNDFDNQYFKKEDFGTDTFKNNDNESENTISKINTILNLDADYNFSIFNLIFSDLKKTIIVVLIMLLLNNSLIVNFLYNLISKLISSKFINNNISLIIRALLTGILFYLSEKFI